MVVWSGHSWFGAQVILFDGRKWSGDRQCSDCETYAYILLLCLCLITTKEYPKKLSQLNSANIFVYLLPPFFFKLPRNPKRTGSPFCLQDFPAGRVLFKQGDLSGWAGCVVGGTWDVLLVLRINGLFHPYMGVSRNRGVPPTWMMKIMENPIKMDDLGVPQFSETPIYSNWKVHGTVPTYWLIWILY